MILEGQQTRLLTCQFPADIAPVGICVFEGQNGCFYAFTQLQEAAKWTASAKQCPAPKSKGTLL
jgi:hypothetical protein